MALAMTVALSFLVFSLTSYVTSNEHSAARSTADTQARAYAEAALDAAYSRIVYANQTTGMNPASPTLLGCGTGSNGASSCSTVTPMCLSFTSSCPSPYTTTSGTATVYGYYTGTNSGAYAGVGAAASTWVLVATGFARDGSGLVDAKSLRGTVTVAAATAGSVAAVWNHIFITAPYVANTCQGSLTGNSSLMNVPLYVIGNFCFIGNSESIKETSGGQPIDLMIGGKLIYAGNSDEVGDYTTSPPTPITSGVVVGGCASSITAATTPCTNGTWRYKVATTDTFISQDDPELTDAQVESKYTSFDPGPKHGCLAGTTPSPLNASQLDFSVGATEGVTSLPNNSGSGSSGAAFNLTPSSSYACISQSGTSAGYLIWNAGSSSLTVSGITVPAKTLAINGSVYIDAPLTISQSMTYMGTGIIMVSGQIQLTGNNMNVCAVNTGCSYTSWQGSSGHNDMLTLASVLQSSNAAFAVVGNSIDVQCSIWLRPSSQLELVGNNSNVQGPMSVGGLNIVANSFNFQPLPVIKNMPVGAPVPPNVSVSISPLSTIG